MKQCSFFRAKRKKQHNIIFISSEATESEVTKPLNGLNSYNIVSAVLKAFNLQQVAVETSIWSTSTTKNNLC